MSGHFRKSDLISRVGGDEFCIIAVNLHKGNIIWKFEGLRKNIGESKIPMQDSSISLTISIGVTMKLEDTLEQSVKIADSLLYQSKKNGRNCISLDVD